MADLRLPMVTTAMITASASRAAPAYISFTALRTDRGGWACSGSCPGPEVGYGAYIAAPLGLLRATRQPLSAGPVGHGRAITTGISERLLTDTAAANELSRHAFTAFRARRLATAMRTR